MGLLQATTGATQETADQGELTQRIGLRGSVVGVGSGRRSKVARGGLLRGRSGLGGLLRLGGALVLLVFLVGRALVIRLVVLVVGAVHHLGGGLIPVSVLNTK